MRMTIDEAIADLPSCPETDKENSTGTEYNVWCENSEYACPYKLYEIRETLKAQKDTYLRLAADFDNYRKRVSKEKEAIAFTAVQQFGKSLFSSIDNIKTAVEAGCKDDPFVEGVKLALSSLCEALSKQGFTQILPKVGSEYDVNTQEAVIAEQSSLKQNHITKVFSSGWTLNGKLVQPAKVAVSK